jgi:hypothetical protein
LFPDTLDQEIKSCDGLVVVVSEGWAEEFARRDASQVERRATNEGADPSKPDYVLAEIATALKHGKRIYPVTVGGMTAEGFGGLPENLPGVDNDSRRRFNEANATTLSDTNYGDSLDKLAQSLWRWPPAAYWISAVLGLIAAVIAGSWLRASTDLGNYGSFAPVALFLGWTVANFVALAGAMKHYPILLGTGLLRGVASSWAGGALGLALVGVALAPALLTRTIVLECDRSCGDWTYEMRQEGTVNYQGVIGANTIARRLLPAWGWSQVEIEFFGRGPGDGTSGARSTSVGGLCVKEIPGPLLVNALQVNDNLPKNTQFVEGDDHMKWLTQQFPVSLRLGWLCSQSGVLSKPVNNWGSAQ